MALWYWNGAAMSRADWHRLRRPERAVLYGAGESLNDADPAEKGAVRFVQNHAYKVVTPHYWVAMDKLEYFEPAAPRQQCMKVLRGPYCDETVDGQLAKEYPDTYWADIASEGRDMVWFERGAHTRFFWDAHTLGVALHLILYMGFRSIAFAGIDLRGEYFDRREVSPEDRALNERLWPRELEFLSWFAGVAKTEGIELVNRSPGSRLEEIMPTAR